MEEVTFGNDYQWDPKDNQKYNNTSDGNTSSGYKKFGKRPTFRPDHFIKTIYTDGGSRILDDPKEPGKKMYVGAWSFYDPDTETINGEADGNATNNQMELTAAIKAIEYLNELGVSKEEWVCLKLDSDYVRLGILFWCKKWIQNNWKRKLQDGTEEDVKNVDLWKHLHELTSDRKVYFDHIKGHSGEPGNERVDINCRMLMDGYLDSIGYKK